MQTLKPLQLVQRTFEAVRLHGRCTAQQPINLSANGSASSCNYLKCSRYLPGQLGSLLWASCWKLAGLQKFCGGMQACITSLGPSLLGQGRAVDSFGARSAVLRT